MILECILLVFLGIMIREVILIFMYGWGYEEKLRIYDEEMKK